MIRTTANLVTAPASEPVTLAEAKLWIKVDTSDEDALITSLITAARESAEKYTRRAFITQTWSLTIDLPMSSISRNLPAGYYEMPITALYADLPNSIELPNEPLQSITSVKTYDTANTEGTYSSANYFADTANSRLALNSTATWPSNLRQNASAMITYVCGYGAASAVPESIKTAIKMHVQLMYDGRIVCEMPQSCMNLLNQYRVNVGLHG